MRSRLRSVLRHDLPASLVVFLVAVPLSLGIAVASGAPVIGGLIAAVVGGVVAGALGGSVLQVSGPAAGLTVVVADLINRFGWGVTCAITVAAGVLQVLFGLSRVARAALAISPAVVHGMLAGVGLTIVFAQLHVVLGGSPDSVFLDNLVQLPGQIVALHGPAALTGLGVIAVLAVWPRLPKRIRVVPGPLVAIGAATLIVTLTGADVARVDLPGSLLGALTTPVLPAGDFGAIAVGVLTVALIASVESLASAVAVDRMHDGPRADLNRELIGQGAANATSGLLGGLPVTGVIVRSSTNAAAGARGRSSAVLHGLWVLVFSALLFGVVELIPLAALAGLLVTVGARLVDLGHLRTLHRHGELAVYLVTVAAVLLLTLLEGVLIGLALAVLLTLRRVMLSAVRAERCGERDWRLAVHGRLSFLSIPRLARELGRIPRGTGVVIELVTDYLDHAAYEYLHHWIERHRAGGGAVLVDEVGQAGLTSSRDRTRDPAPRHLPRWFTPWPVWQRREHPDELGPLLDGLREYERRSRDLVAPYLAELATGQRPKAMWICCGDSRVVPNVLTSSGPGDLFTLRNIGNLVPVHGTGDGSVAAALEYGIDVLGVPVLAVCGHSGCGAMHAVLGADPGRDGPLAGWLRTADGAVARWRGGDPIAAAAAADGHGELDQLVMVNVAEQLRNLRSHPVVAAAEAAGRTRLVGVFFDIATGRLRILDDTGTRFAPIPDRPVGALNG